MSSLATSTVKSIPTLVTMPSGNGPTPTGIEKCKGKGSADHLVIPQDIPKRSSALAEHLFAQLPIDTGLVQSILNPLLPATDSSPFEQSCKLLSEVLPKTLLDENPMGSIRTEHYKTLLGNIAAAFQWAVCDEQWNELSVVRSSVLNSMLPIYLNRSGEHWDKSLAQTLCLLQRVVTLRQWRTLLSEPGSLDWLKSDAIQGVMPQESFERAFKISFASMSDQYWNLLAKSNSKHPLLRATPIDLHLEKGLWSIANQLTKRTTKLTIPTQIRVGVVSWERVLNHWDQLVEALKSVSYAVAENKEEPQSRRGDSAVPTPSTNRPGSSRENDHRLVEIRTATDPQLATNLVRLLDHCRQEQSLLSLVVVKRLKELSTSSGSSSGEITNWQSRFIDAMIRESQLSDLKGFITDSGELALVFPEVDRSNLANWIRLSFGELSGRDNGQVAAMGDIEPLVAGVAMVAEPTRAFKIDQLTEAAWRCLDGASIQGAHAVKTIQVY